MAYRTDLAIESASNIDVKNLKGIKQKIEKTEELTITEIKIEEEEAAKSLGKPTGSYITIEFPSLSKSCKNLEEKIKIVSEKIQKLVPKDGLVFVVGLGNSSITPDALGPKVIESVLATRHLKKEIKELSDLSNLRAVTALAPGVLGQTGIEVVEIISSICKSIKPNAVIVIDALAAKELYRLGTTIQISSTGILPGSGVGNKRPAINKETIGVPVISVGIPTVVDALNLVSHFFESLDNNLNEGKSSLDYLHKEAKSMIVTPREIDLLIERSAEITSMAINLALQPLYSFEELKFLAS